MNARRLLTVGLLCWLSMTASWMATARTSTSAQVTSTVSGTVRDAEGPVAGATVRVQTTLQATETDNKGRFVLAVAGGGPFRLTAWAEGYFCAGPVEANAGSTGVEVQLVAHSGEDNPAYRWLSSRGQPGLGESQGCAECHSAAESELSFTLPVDEWELDAHSQSAANQRFLTMYLGTDVYGNQSPLTRYVTVKDYGAFPLHPDLSQPWFGPGYKLDFPDTAGNCAACHTPAAAVNAPYNTSPTRVTGVGTEGIPCDFCHKVWDIQLDTSSGLPYPNRPGVLSYEFRRPPEDHQYFAGPFDDVAPGEDTYSALQTESQFCAGCHYGVFWDTVVYNSFGEWLSSSYSDSETGQTCQDCHMPPVGTTHFALPGQGGLARNPQSIFSHRMPGALDSSLLQNTVELMLDPVRIGDAVQVRVTATNTGAGHHAPTDSPLRQMLLVVTATNSQGEPLALTDGPVLPDWAGDLEGQPGVYFAHILREVWTEIQPTGSYWNPTRTVEDTRLPALSSHTSAYTFTAIQRDPVTIEVRLIFRRAFYELMQQKGWDTPDILMEHMVVEGL